MVHRAYMESFISQLTYASVSILYKIYLYRRITKNEEFEELRFPHRDCSNHPNETYNDQHRCQAI